jgi:hypothetical protein
VSELSLIRDLRDQLRRDQQDVKRITAHVDVARSKASQAATAERYLLSEIDSLGKSLKCEYSSIAGSAFVLSALDDCLICSSIFADACLDEKAESHRVNAHLNAAQTHTNSIADNFWADWSKAQALSLLQDRISQDGVLAETCRSALAVVHKVMFPLNDQPDGLPALLERFENGEAIYRFV